MNYKSEKDFLDVVEECLIDYGYKTWREVIPDQCIDWENPYRVDLIFYSDAIGYVGVEGKNINSLKSAVDISNAIDQIQNKYEPLTYFKGNIISTWCITSPTENTILDKNSIEIAKEFLINFLKTRYNINFLEYNNGKIKIKLFNSPKTFWIGEYRK